MISGCVTVTGPPVGDLLLEQGHHAAVAAQDVAEPHRHKFRFGLRRFIICTTISHRRLDAPMMLVGFTALSVEISTKRFTPCRAADRAIL